jgi:hypothetical protein
MAEGLCHKDRKNKANKANNHKETRSKEQSLNEAEPQRSGSRAGRNKILASTVFLSKELLYHIPYNLNLID